MNIFFTSNNPKTCASNLDNKRIIKMILETAQMLSTGVRVHLGDREDERSISELLTACYKPTHKNHPSNIWIRETRDNFKWGIEHFIYLNEFYTKFSDRTHKSYSLLDTFKKATKFIPEGNLTDFANCARNKEKGFDFTHLPVYDAYRNYLKARWETDKLPVKWTNRDKPEWLDCIEGVTV